MAQRNGAQGPLAGVRVVDMTWAWAGPHGTQLLALLGAEVIKVESHARLDHSRMRSLMGGAMKTGPDGSPIFNDLNANKLSLTLDLRKDAARDLLRRLVSVSDVLAQNMRPGVLERLGLSYEELTRFKSDLIMLSSSAVGSTGPERLYAGYAPTFASLSGIADVTGYPDGPPQPLSGSVDLRVGTAGAFAVVAALYRRRQTGEGQHIDLSSTEVMTSMMGEAFMELSMTGRVPGRNGNRHDVMAPHGCYPCAGEDQWVSIAIGSDEEWTALKAALGDPGLEAEAYAGPAERWQNQESLDPIIERWTRQRPLGDAVDQLQAAGVPAMRVHLEDSIASDPHVVARGYFQELEHPVLGRRLVGGAPWTFSEDDVGVHRPAPLLGQHNEAVLGDILGLAPEEIERLVADEVVR
ncbi:MAG: CoA transferase [Deltaproteobacteria bacterium]|nr:CoA transferase [Deltaproteobacteria bacterium]